MNKQIIKVILSIIFCLCLIFQCSDDPTSSNNEQMNKSRTFAGKIMSLNTQVLNWNGLKLGLINIANLEVLGEIQYTAGEALCCMDIVSDSCFSFTLPDNIDERWLAVSGNSPIFYTIAFNDTNNNNLFEYEPDPEPYEILLMDGNMLGNVFYVTYPESYSVLNIDVSIGWNYLTSTSTASTDFNKTFLLR